MAPLTQTFEKDEKVLCFHHELLYEAKVLDARHTDASDKKSPWQYLIHYKGWKNTWDDWVPADRLRKHSEENLELARSLKKEMERQASAAAKPKTAVSTKRKGPSGRGSEERHSTPQIVGKKRPRDQDTEKEETHQQRQMIYLPIPDLLKAVLVDDWELITSKKQFVVLPSATPISMILEEWSQVEIKRRGNDADSIAHLQECVTGLKAYGDVAIGRRMLYRQERMQYWNLLQRKANESDDLYGKRITDIYGAEHFLRHITHMPELMVHTALEDPSIMRIREEIIRLLNWLAKHEQMAKYFSVPYANTYDNSYEVARGSAK